MPMVQWPTHLASDTEPSIRQLNIGEQRISYFTRLLRWLLAFSGRDFPILLPEVFFAVRRTLWANGLCEETGRWVA